MSRFFWVVALVLILSSGFSFALAPAHIIARGIVNPDNQNSVLAAGAGISATDSCYGVNNSGFSSVLPLVWFDVAGVYPYNGNGGGIGSVLSLPIVTPMNYVFTQNYFTYQTSASGGDCFGTIINYTQYPYSWNQFDNGTAWNSGVVSFGIYNSTSAPSNSFFFNFSSYPTMLTFYNNTGEMFLSTFGLPNPPSTPSTCPSFFSCGGMLPRGVQYHAKYSPTPPNLTIILQDYTPWSISTSLPFSQSVWFNFHTTAVSGSGPDSLYHLKIDDNSLNVSALNNIPMAYGTVSNVVLANPNLYPGDLCVAGPWVPGGSFIIDTNTFAINDSYIVCLNMSAYNGGREFRAMMRITNASAALIFSSGSLDANMFLISPKDKFFYNVSYSPIVPSTLASFTISVDFAYPMVGRLNYQRTVVNATQPPENITSAYGTHHSFTIPQFELNYSSVTINLSLEGLDSLPVTNVRIQQPEYTLFATNITPVFPGVITSINPYEDIVNHISSGLNLIIDTAPCPICVPPQNHLSIPGICTVDGGPDRGTTMYTITPFNSTSTPYAHVAHFTLAEINGTGEHNVSCRPTISNSLNFQQNNTAINVSVDPTFSLVFLPRVSGCDSVALGFSQGQCENLTLGMVQNLTYYDSWYCAQRGPPGFSSSYCSYWDGYACSNASAIPSGFTVNGSTMNVGCVSPPPGNFSQPPANFTVPPILANNTAIVNAIYNILGMTPYVFLNFISLIVVAILTIITAIKSKSGLATGVVSIISLFIFMVAGWLPLWVFIVVAILVTFLVSKFARETIFGGH
jgi:hypothetical protein